MRAGVVFERVSAGRVASLAKRDRQAAKTAGANLIALSAHYLIRLAVIPLSLALLGRERYGLFLAVGSLVAWGGLLDLGFAPGLVNVVAWASGREDRKAIQRYISTALTAYSVLALVLSGAAVGLSRWPGLAPLLGATDPGLAADARLLVLVCGLLFAATTLMRVIPTACTALQEGYYGAWPQIVGNLLSLCLLAGLYWSGRTSLLGYALVMGLPPLVAQIGLGVFYFSRRHPDLRPRFGYADAASLRALWGVGWPLALHQAANVAVLYAANVLIANRLGPAAVPEYSVPYALYAVLISVTWYIVSPFVPAYAEAAARGDFAWIRRRARQMLAFTAALLSLGGGALLILGPVAIPLWTGRRVQPALSLLIALACFALARGCSNTNSVLLTGLGAVRFLGSTYLAVGALYIAGGWWLAPRLGVMGVPIAGAVAHFIHVLLSTSYASRKLRRSCSESELHGVRHVAISPAPTHESG